MSKKSPDGEKNAANEWKACAQKMIASNVKRIYGKSWCYREMFFGTFSGRHIFFGEKWAIFYFGFSSQICNFWKKGIGFEFKSFMNMKFEYRTFQRIRHMFVWPQLSLKLLTYLRLDENAQFWCYMACFRICIKKNIFVPWPLSKELRPSKAQFKY